MADELQRKLAYIAATIASGSYRYTIHGAQQSIRRQIHPEELTDAVMHGEIIEDYPHHHYGPACLILGATTHGRILHIVCSVRSVVDIITVYDPDLTEWEYGFRTRKT